MPLSGLSHFPLNCKNGTQNAAKLDFLSSKIETKSGEGHPFLTPYPLSALGASILAPTALDTRAAPSALDLGASAPVSPFAPLATPSGSAPAAGRHNGTDRRTYGHSKYVSP